MWNKDGKPAVIVMQPYSIGNEDMQEISELCERLGLRATVSNNFNWHFPTGVVTLMISRKDNPERSKREDGDE